MRSIQSALGVLMLAAATGCTTVQKTEKHEHSHLADLRYAICVVTPTEGNDVRGTVTFLKKGNEVTITADIRGLEPNEKHAWHIHEWGDISSKDGKATGGHYNPEGHPHALPSHEIRHAGDLGNLHANDRGHAKKTLTVDNITIGGHKNPIVGRAIIIHAKMDDGGQPTGNAGARIGQGVIGVAKE